MSDLLQRKLKTYFVRYDKEGKGMITKKDYEELGEGFIQAGDLQGEEAQKMRDTWKKIWALLEEGAGGKDFITLDEFIHIYDTVDNMYIKEQVITNHLIFFDAIDTNHDGYIQSEEFEQYFKVFGVEKKFAEASFKVIDRNQDGVISKQEFVDAAFEFFTSKEDTPSKIFFGPLVD